MRAPSIRPGAVEAPQGTCAARVLLCSDVPGERFTFPRPELHNLYRIQPRLGVRGLAQALGIRVATLDAWVCAPGLSPSKAADLDERFRRLVVHTLTMAGRCSCRLCTPTAQQRLDDRERWLEPDCMPSPLPFRCRSSEGQNG